MTVHAETCRFLPTRYSQYGPRGNVRAAYRRLPCQWFWTWVTGKGIPLSAERYKAALQPASSSRVALHLLWSWTIIGVAIVLGWRCVESQFYLGIPLCWLLIVNRARSLQATFHYMTHGAAMPNRGLARLMATVLFTTPFFYAGWERYGKSHVQTHHHLRVLCSAADPDQQFIARHGFRPGMGELSFWARIWLTPFKPDYLFHQAREALHESVVQSSAIEFCYRFAFWSAVVASMALTHHLCDFVFFLLIPVFILFQHSLWLQLITEHLWFSSSTTGSRTPYDYGKLTFGRFQGRVPPRAGVLAWTTWIAKLVMFDVPVRLYIYPQDLPNHDFHHRMPLVSYFQLADVRATLESEIGRFGPMYESWGFMSTVRMMRDRLCYNKMASFSSLHVNH